ncbi:hypothetical protein RND71_024239 [Anisodus tanguticus]|uniref:Tryptophan synthase n=1 Tax=Anisodus tanguticus TaxID=243964 RepID=A0AAE1V3T1_9SOLA|nr:hypothetical protein RND71_024239 [Anisodus tanguticus]
MTKLCRKIVQVNIKWKIFDKVSIFKEVFRFIWEKIIVCSTGRKPVRYRRLSRRGSSSPAMEEVEEYGVGDRLTASCSGYDSDSDLVTLKISILGDCQIGKTSFVIKYVGDEQEKRCLEMKGLNLMDKTLVVRGARIAFRIWDTAIPILIGTKFDDFVQLPPDIQWSVVTQQHSITCDLTGQSISGQDTVVQRPDSFGWFGEFGGKYVPETLVHALDELETAFNSLATDHDFQKELDGILRDYVGREGPLYFVERLTEHYKRPDGEGPLIYLKREDLNHTGAHKINNAVAQALLAKRLGKKHIIAETGAGQHGVATATVCARFGLECVIYMGAQDMERQALNVFRMRLLGAEVRAVHSGTATLKDATSEAIRDWVTNVETTHYILGSVAGPHPYPMTVREFHAVIGKEKQALESGVGNQTCLLHVLEEFVDDKDVRLIEVEAAGFGLDSGKHAATLTKGEVRVLHGAMSYLLQDEDGQIVEPHSISAGLDYTGVGPEHSFLKDFGRAEYHSITDEEALEAFKGLSRLEGIIPALETSHALAYLEKLCPTLPSGTKVVLNCSGREDKDVQTAIKYLKV